MATQGPGDFLRAIETHPLIAMVCDLVRVEGGELADHRKAVQLTPIPSQINGQVASDASAKLEGYFASISVTWNRLISRCFSRTLRRTRAWTRTKLRWKEDLERGLLGLSSCKKKLPVDCCGKFMRVSIYNRFLLLI